MQNKNELKKKEKIIIKGVSLNEHFVILLIGILYQLALSYVYIPLAIPVAVGYYFTWFGYLNKIEKNKLRLEYKKMYDSLKKPVGRHGR